MFYTIVSVKHILDFETHLASYANCPFQTKWCSLENYSIVCLKIMRSYTREYETIWKKWSEMGQQTNQAN